MRVYNQGSFVKVTCTEFDVMDFKAKWPCSNLPTIAISFTFQKSNGDLVDICPDIVGQNNDALLALSYNAGNYAAKRLKLQAMERK